MKHLHLAYQQLKAFLSQLVDTYWIPIDVSLKAAIIGVFSALAVAYLQDWQQKRREHEQQSSTEQNKLKYLYFLMNDTKKLINFYNVSVFSIRKSIQENIFIIPNLNTYNVHSLNTIANKLNQEDYYLSLVNQLKNIEAAELFLQYNALYNNYTKAVDHFNI